MSRFICVLGITLVLAGCAAEGGLDEPPITEEPIEITPEVITVEASGGGVSGATGVAVTVESGVVYPETPIPPDQITPYVEPTATLIPPLQGGLGPSELKYRVLAEFPDFFFCDPDYYPVAREDEMVLARQRFPELQANPEEFNTILAHNGLAGATSFDDDQMLLIYREHKRLRAIYFELIDGGYRFQIQEAETEGSGELITATIDGQGTITVLNREPSFATCPICLAAGTWIDTPDGAVRIEDVRPGMRVWTVDGAGRRVAQPVLAVGKTVTPLTHQVIHLVLSDGRELWVSAGHPTPDGRTVGSLAAGDRLDGAVVLTAARIAYPGGATYDVLPAGETGFYWANGILMASTLP